MFNINSQTKVERIILYSLEGIKNETVDLEKVPIDEVFNELKCNREGLSTTEGEKGSNFSDPTRREKGQSFLLVTKVLKLQLDRLLVINSTISFIEENNAGKAAAALMAGLAPKTKRWTIERAGCGNSGTWRHLTLKGHVESVLRLKGLDNTLIGEVE